MRFPDNDLIITADHITVEYGSTLALDDVSLAINSGDFVAITGPNGGGKSTLLKTLLKLIKPTSGTVSYYENGAPVESLHIGYLPQKSNIDNRYRLSAAEKQYRQPFPDYGGGGSGFRLVRRPPQLARQILECRSGKD